ncbi:unnamed protein product, partial [marine sediment metagenome]
NLKAIKSILPNAEFHAIEINKKAYDILIEWGGSKAYHQSILDFKSKVKFDLVFTKGVLIHINPDQLSRAYIVACKAAVPLLTATAYFAPT